MQAWILIETKLSTAMISRVFFLRNGIVPSPTKWVGAADAFRLARVLIHRSKKAAGFGFALAKKIAAVRLSPFTKLKPLSAYSGGPARPVLPRRDLHRQRKREVQIAGDKLDAVRTDSCETCWRFDPCG